MVQDRQADSPQSKLQQVEPPYRRLFRQLINLHHPARLAVCVFMSALVNGERVVAIINQLARERNSCPHCQGARIYRHGVANCLQRYRCRSCGVTFNGLTGTPLARLRLKHRWLAYLDCLRDPACTVHSAARQTGVHPNTSFRWRHRFLAWAKLDRPRALEGVAEADDMYFLESEKGKKQLHRAPRRRGGLHRVRRISNELVNIVMARDRGGKTIDFIAGRGALQPAALHCHLLPKLARDVILMSGANGVYQTFARQARIRHEAVDGRPGAPCLASVHIDNVNGYHGRFRDWLRHFNGVATRYLENYLGWRWAIDRQRIDTADGLLRAALGIFNS